MGAHIKTGPVHRGRGRTDSLAAIEPVIGCNTRNVNAFSFHEVRCIGIVCQVRDVGAFGHCIIEVLAAQAPVRRQRIFGAESGNQAPRVEVHRCWARRVASGHSELGLCVANADAAEDKEIVDRRTAAKARAAEEIRLCALRVAIKIDAALVERAPGAVDFDAIDQASVLPVVAGLRAAEGARAVEINRAGISAVVVSAARICRTVANVTTEIKSAPVGYAKSGNRCRDCLAGQLSCGCRQDANRSNASACYQNRYQPTCAHDTTTFIHVPTEPNY